MAPLPTGTVTFLFTDIEGSTQLWEHYPELARAALVRHDALIEDIVTRYRGDVVRPRGEGDSRFAVFPLATDAVGAAASIQEALFAEPWTTPTPLRARMALHTGEADLRDGDYYGSAVNRCARLRSAGYGGQTLLSEITYGLVRDALPRGVAVLDMGQHRLRDLIRPEHIFQLVVNGLPAEFPPLKTLDNRPNNLPLQPTPLVGREKELADAGKLLGREDVKLVTLTGPGGTGKTRLGLQIASELLDHFPDGVWFVDLSPLRDSGLVVPTIAVVLGVKETPGQPLIDTLQTYLKDKQLLLMLDNFEQVGDAAPQISRLLASSTGLKVLTTSRVPLSIRGEKEYPVPPLSVPDVQHMPSLERLTQFEAVRLFIERAIDVKPDFQITNKNAPAVAQICVQLDGLPLAIELAAARVRMLSPEALLTRLSQKLRVLTGGAKDVPARQQTLRNTIEWSYDLLDEEEKQLFRRIAPFSGGRSLEALEAVCNYDGKLQIEVFDGVESLLSKSLLREVEARDGEPRLWMLETIHEYAREKLDESGEANALNRQHALYFMKFAERAEPHLKSQEQQEWLDRLENEYDNIRAALIWARKAEKGIDDNEGRETEIEAAEIGLRIGGAVGSFWRVRGYYSEGREQLKGLLEMKSAREGYATAKSVLPDADGDPDGDQRQGTSTTDMTYRAVALNWAGLLARLQGDYASARSLFEESLTIRRQLDDKWGIAYLLNNLGNIALEQGDYSPARSLFDESLALNREIGDKRGIAVALNNMGIVAQQQGDNSSARSLFEESLVMRRQLGDKRGVASSLSNLGNVAFEQGDYAPARSLFDESLALNREIGDKRGAAISLNNLANVAFEQRDYTSAGLLFEESLEISRELGDKLGIASTLAGLGGVEIGRESDTNGARTIGSGEAVEADGTTTSGIASRLWAGASLLGAVEALLESMGAVLASEDRRPYDRGIDQARAQLGEEEFERARQKGRAMSMEEAVEYALQES